MLSLTNFILSWCSRNCPYKDLSPHLYRISLSLIALAHSISHLSLTRAWFAARYLSSLFDIWSTVADFQYVSSRFNILFIGCLAYLKRIGKNTVTWMRINTGYSSIPRAVAYRCRTIFLPAAMCSVISLSRILSGCLRFDISLVTRSTFFVLFWSIGAPYTQLVVLTSSTILLCIVIVPFFRNFFSHGSGDSCLGWNGTCSFSCSIDAQVQSTTESSRKVISLYSSPALLLFHPLLLLLLLLSCVKWWIPCRPLGYLHVSSEEKKKKSRRRRREVSLPIPSPIPLLLIPRDLLSLAHCIMCYTWSFPSVSLQTA